MINDSAPRRRAAVCGKPIRHSLSPVIHSAGFVAAGLLSWSYTAIECAAAELPALVAGLGPEWAGLSLTMPLKEVALEVADSASPAASAIGAANTLIRRDDGSWHADNTDIVGMIRVLRAAGVGSAPRFTVLGGGGTARAALAAAAALGSPAATVVTRRPEAAAELSATATILGVELISVPWSRAPAAFDAHVIISAVPKGAADSLAADVSWWPETVLFDAVYDPWPTPLAAAAAEAGCTVVSGLDLLLAQAVGQFEQFTGVRPAPEAAMRSALWAAAALR
ncbi:MAG: shikimate dehydrogenase [Actinoplanes sp.]|nr:shikimate dehydrogenase [Actinoplanes sp.]